MFIPFLCLVGPSETSDAPSLVQFPVFYMWLSYLCFKFTHLLTCILLFLNSILNLLLKFTYYAIYHFPPLLLPSTPPFIPLPSTIMNFNCGPSLLVDKHRETKTGSLLINIFSAEVKQNYGLPLLQLLLLYLVSSLWYLAPFSIVLCFLLIYVYLHSPKDLVPECYII